MAYPMILCAPGWRHHRRRSEIPQQTMAPKLNTGESTTQSETFCRLPSLVGLDRRTARRKREHLPETVVSAAVQRSTEEGPNDIRCLPIRIQGGLCIRGKLYIVRHDPLHHRLPPWTFLLWCEPLPT